VSRLKYGVLDGLTNFSSLILVSVALVLPGFFLLASFNVSRVIREVEQRYEVVVYLADGLSESKREDLGRRIGAFLGVESITYVSPQDALLELRRELGDDASDLQGLDRNPLPGSLRLKLTSRFLVPDSISQLALKLKDEVGVDRVEYGREWIGRFHGVKVLAWRGVLGLLIASGIVSLILLGYASRSSLWSQRMVRRTSRNVEPGSPPVEGLVRGLLASGIALLILWLFNNLIPLQIHPLLFPPPAMLVGFVAAGTILGLLGGLLGTIGIPTQ
jgi:cell division transport system permease protein